MSSEWQKECLEAVWAGHYVDSPNVEVLVRFGEVGVARIFGHSTPLREVGVPVVQIFTDASMPRIPVMRPEAGEEFEHAARQLAAAGTEFYTVLHPTWGLRVLRWTLERI